MSAKIHIVNFGQSNGGLTTVGYTIYNIDGTIKTARSTSGVVEYGTGTGIYGANIDYDQFSQLLVIWDTGGAVPRYAVEENRTTLAAIQDETDHIRMIWNTLKNQGEVFLKILKALQRLEHLKNHDNDFEKVLEQIKKLIDREIVQIKDIKEALKITVNPIVKLPKAKEADLSALIGKLEEIKASIKTVPQQNGLEVVNDNVKTIGNLLQQVVKAMPNDDLLDVLKENVQYLKEQKQKDRYGRLKTALRV